MTEPLVIATAGVAVNTAQNALNSYLDAVTGGATDETKRVRLTRNTPTAGIITMNDWDGTLGDFWVIDDDDWAYWESPLENGIWKFNDGR